MKAEGGVGFLGEFEAFAALGVGEDAEAVVAVFWDALDEDHADAGCSGERGGGEGGGVGVVGLGFGGLG